MTSSERIRLVYSILTSSSKTTTKTTTSTLDSSSAPPLSLVPNCPQFPRVLSIFPPHDPKFNRNWMKLWSSRTHVLSIPSSELTMLKVSSILSFFYAPSTYKLTHEPSTGSFRFNNSTLLRFPKILLLISRSTHNIWFNILVVQH